MRKMKKFLCAVLTTTMVLAMAAPSFAAKGDPGTITIENAVVGQDYNVYKLLDAKQSTVGDSWAYTVNENWVAFFNTDAAKAYFSVDAAKNVTWVESEEEKNATSEAQKTELRNARAKGFASLALKYATDNNIQPIATQNDVTGVGDATTAQITFGNLGLGYFLLDSSAGTLLSLDTNSPSMDITEKNEVPSVPSKSVVSIVNANTEAVRAGNLTSVSIGDTVNYRVVINAKEGAENYVLHDEMDEGLNFQTDSVVVYKVTTATPGASDLTDTSKVATANYTVKTTGFAEGDECDFEVVFTQKYCDTLTDADYLVVDYSATFVAGTTIATNGYNNNAHLTYGDGGETPDTPKKVFTFDIPVLKYTGTLAADGTLGTNASALAGAVFTLSYDAAGENVIRITGSDGNYQVAADQTVDVTDENTQMTTPANGNLKIDGLAAGVYYLTEVTAPSGYNKLTDPVTVEITAQVTGEGETAAATKTMYNGLATNGTIATTINVQNNAGSLLPSTGGIGTTIFYVAGIILMAGAVFFVVRRKRV